jgi:3-phytase
MMMTMRKLLISLAAALAAAGTTAQDLSLDKQQGLLLRDAAGNTLDHHALRAKRWDRRGDIALLQDTYSGELRLLRATGNKLQLLGRWPGPDFAVEQLCLHRDAQGLLHVFLLGEGGEGAQWLLQEDKGKARPVRHLAAPLAPSACRVRDGEARLYIAEPGVGLWAYAADAERDAARELLVHAPRDDEDALNRRLDDWLAAHPEQPVPVLPIVLPTAQTATMKSQGDAADDPAIWVHAAKPAQGSRVLGTDKKRGLAVYDLQGRELQFLPVGRVNNVDLRQGLRYGGRSFDLAVASQRDEAGLVLFGIGAADGRVSELARLPTSLNDIYGICVGRNAEGGLDVFPNDKDGRVLQLRLRRDARGGWSAEHLREIRLASQPEGCVVDEAQRLLFVGEERHGVWRIALDDARAAPVLAVPLGPTLTPDIEGLAIYDGGARGGRYLVVSSQGSDSYALFDAAAPHAPRGAFRIGLNAALGIDGASETDGLEVTSANLGGAYARGLLVVQDGRKRLPQGPQNFKLVPWSAVERALKLP